MQNYLEIQLLLVTKSIWAASKKTKVFMRLSIVLIALFTGQLQAKNDSSQTVLLNINAKNQSVKNVLEEIENQSEFNFFYNNKNIDVKRQVSINVKNVKVFDVLDKIFDGKNVSYSVMDNNIILSTKKIAIAKTAETDIKISGRVFHENSESIIGANIQVKGTTLGTITDIDGAFNLDVPENAILVISYIGFKTQEIQIKKNTQLEIILKEDIDMLDELVVVGYGSQKKVNLTGAVSSVNTEEINDVPTGSLSNALSGRVAGVLVTQSGGKPGAGSSIQIRAQGTWNNADPLYVIDGVIRDKFAFDGLDANDVENLSVLKDAASSAIYGARAANGVVLITTKKGNRGKPTVNYSGTFGLSDAIEIPETQNAYEQARFINDNLIVGEVASDDQRYYTDDELAHFKNNSYSWLDEAWEQPMLTKHALNVAGGNDRVRYFIGGSYYQESGSFENLEFKKHTLRANIEANVTDDLIVSLNLSTDVRNDDKPYWRWDNDNDTMSDLYKALLFRTAQVPPYVNGLPTGSFVEWHPLEIIGDETGYNNKKHSSYDATIALEYNVPFVKGLSLKFTYNKYDRHTFIKQFNRPYTLYEFEMTGEHNHIITDKVKSTRVKSHGDYLYEKYDTQSTYQLNGVINYAASFGKHDIGGLFVYEQSEGNVNWFDGTRNYFISSTVDQLFAGSSDSKNSTLNGSGSETGRISYVGRLNYAYDHKYLFEASFRYDGSLNFAPQNRWGLFPSGSAAWRISEEDFFKENIQFVDYLKLRASAGLLGNDAVGGWQWLQSYKLVDGAQFGTLSNGLEANVIPNEDITWEKSLTYNIGIDAGFLKNKLMFNLDMFYKNTYDILGTRVASLPTTFGASMPEENYAEIDARGFEVELAYADKIGESFSYYVKGNLGYATNKLIAKDEAENLRPYQTELGYNTDRQMGYVADDIIRTEADLNALPSGYTIFGVAPELGMLNYRDIRGANSDEPDGKIDEHDKDWIINHKTAPINYGVTLGLSWNNFALDLFFQGVAGSERMIDYRGSQARPQETNFAFWNDHWTPENIDAKYPRAGNSQSDKESTFWVENSSFLRLKNANISYTMPKALVSSWNMDQIKFFVTGNNLLMLQNELGYYDPENSSILAYPLMRSYSLGVNIAF
jgi:TonB-linked SusC/RagA family outer membrane protein